MTTAHQYSIRASDPGAHLFEVRVTVAVPDPAGQIFAVPAWIPGSYMIRDFAKHVVSIRAESDDREVAFQKLDKSRWRAPPVDRSLTLIAEIFAFDDNVRGAHLDNTHAYFNGACVFPAVVGQENTGCVLDILPPDDNAAAEWRVATSMQRKDAGLYQFGSYQALNYAELIDHPVEAGQLAIGEFDVLGIPHAIAIRGRTRVDMARICHDLQTLCECHQQLLGRPADLDRYLFLLHAPGDGYAGLAVGVPRNGLGAPVTGAVNALYGVFGGLDSSQLWYQGANPVANKPKAPGLPTTFALLPAYPNPFNPSTTLRYDVPEAGLVRITVFDVLGREVTLLVNEEHVAGHHEIVFDAQGKPSGLYLVRMEAGNTSQTQRVTLLR